MGRREKSDCFDEVDGWLTRSSLWSRTLWVHKVSRVDAIGIDGSIGNTVGNIANL